MVSILPWIAFGIIPVTVVYWFLLLYYRQTGNDLQRLDALSRSPVQAMLSEALDGAAAIRVFVQTTNFTEKFYSVVDQNSSALLCFVSAQRWMAFRIELLGSLIVLISSVLMISMNDTLGIDAGLAGLLVSNIYFDACAPARLPTVSPSLYRVSRLFCRFFGRQTSQSL